MSLIPIQITGAKVTAISFQYVEIEPVPTFACTVDLIDSRDRIVTSINITSANWMTDRCEPSLKLIELSAKLRNEMNDIVTLHMNRKQNILEAK